MENGCQKLFDNNINKENLKREMCEIIYDLATWCYLYLYMTPEERAEEITKISDRTEQLKKKAEAGK